ncbi:uncharacterized protein HD556DRAFT_1313453 [Suillus plorans]|uniref:Uncharacterized protein n=1 Tax=Suillus plorans TaxID=116603 RepID=A0A9P7DAQ8_9AGAM|nr:uncharacterized protein HD556DRAFT_1313453 [Suillus plorans]KAG1786432.1 hypothetical protein HD556DRAFT_1313453 [Suillus plorans]
MHYHSNHTLRISINLRHFCDRVVKDPPKTCKATARAYLPLSRVRQAMRKCAKRITKKISKLFKRSRNHIPEIQNVDLQDVSSNQNIERGSGHVTSAPFDRRQASHS